MNLRDLKPGAIVRTSAGRSARVMAIDKSQGRVEVETLPARMWLRPVHLAVDNAPDLVIINAPDKATNEEPGVGGEGSPRNSLSGPDPCGAH